MITNYKYFSNLFIPTPSRLLSWVNKIVSSQRSSKSFQGALLSFFFYARDSLIQIFSPVCKTAICNKSGFPTFVCGLFGERVVVCWHCLQIPRSRIFLFRVYQRQENFTAVQYYLVSVPASSSLAVPYCFECSQKSFFFKCRICFDMHKNAKKKKNKSSCMFPKTC